MRPDPCEFRRRSNDRPEPLAMHSHKVVIRQVDLERAHEEGQGTEVVVAVDPVSALGQILACQHIPASLRFALCDLLTGLRLLAADLGEYRVLFGLLWHFSRRGSGWRAPARHSVRQGSC